METSDNPRLIAALNRMLAKEHACSIRYATHAAMVVGPWVEPVSKRFLEISSDEIEHASKLRKRIRALGGTPTMKVDAGNLQTAGTLEEMIEVNLQEEREAVEEYTALLKSVPRLNVLLFRTLEDILQDEQEHLEELHDLLIVEKDQDRLEVRTGVLAQEPEQMSSIDSRD